MTLLELALLALARPDRLHARRLSAAAAAGWSALAAARGSPGVEPFRPAVEPDHRCARRAGRDRAQARERARARLSRRAPRADRRLRRLRRRTVELAREVAAARPSACACWTCHGAARSPPRTRRSRSAGGEILAFSDANAFWEPDALELLVQPVRRRARRLRLRPASLPERGRQPTRRAPTGATRPPCARSRAGSDRSPPATARSTRCGASAYLRLDPRTSHDLLVAVQPRQARLARRATSRWRAPVERPLPTVEGEFRRKRQDDEPRLADRARRRDARPARLRAPVRRSRSSRTACCATRRRCCTWSRSGRTSRWSADGRVYVAHARRAARAAGRRGARARSPAVACGLFALCYYYVLVTASLAAGLWDWLRRGTPTTWERAEGRS